MKKPVIYAHRGASAYAPENTGAAFRKALDMKADGIELDVHLSKDGHVVVIHDEKVDRTSNGKGLIRDLKLDELKSLDFGAWFSSEFAGEPIMTLDEVLSLLDGWDGILNIELKSGYVLYDNIEQKVIDLLRQHKRIEKCIISSFNHYSLLEIKKLEPALKIGLLYSAGLVDPWKYAKMVGAEAIHPFFSSAQAPVVKGCNDNGIIINPWTIDQPEIIKALTQFGVDGIITNVPDVAIQAVNSIL
jgi:glycerophosphoryl diester phosphodiesterase